MTGDWGQETGDRRPPGENCSPILFSLFINELANEVAEKGKHGITLSPDLIQILIMLFADDVVFISNTVVGLQQQLNILRETANRLKLVNLEKSKVVIFRKGGHVAAREKWLYDGMKLEVVNEYKYLGVIFSTGLTFSLSDNQPINQSSYVSIYLSIFLPGLANLFGLRLFKLTSGLGIGSFVLRGGVAFQLLSGSCKQVVEFLYCTAPVGLVVCSSSSWNASDGSFQDCIGETGDVVIEALVLTHVCILSELVS